MIKRFWELLGQKLGRTGRTGLLVGSILIIISMIFAGYFLLRTDYQVLFADLTPQDTMAMTAELDRLKIPYILSDQGSNIGTIMVDKADVYKTRIKVMGKDIPLHGAVGFELFNNSDFGMTEFAQKINYQRALQGELTRTILSLTEIRDARVLLALPDQGLFKQPSNKPKASVALTIKQGQSLRSEQITGIQRLVSAAVPGISAQDVTIVDGSGVALTHLASDGDGETGVGIWSSRLELKKETEAYLARKASDVLLHALGPAQAQASVDVTLDMDRVQSNTDEIVGAPGKRDKPQTGVVVKDRETSREREAPTNTHANPEANGSSSRGSSQSEIEYAVGHRVEQVISQPGSIRQIQVAVLINKNLNPDQQQQLRKMIAASVGASFERGDSVVLQSLEGLNGPTKNSDGLILTDPDHSSPGLPKPTPPFGPLGRAPGNNPNGKYLVSDLTSFGWMPLLILAMAALVLVLLFKHYFFRSEPAPHTSTLSETQRLAALAQVQVWMQQQPRQTGVRGTPEGEIEAKTGPSMFTPGGSAR